MKKIIIYPIFLFMIHLAQAQNPEDVALIQAVIEKYAMLEYYYDEVKVITDKTHKTKSHFSLSDEGTFKTLYQKNGKFLFQGKLKGRFSSNEITISRISADSLSKIDSYSKSTHSINDISFLIPKFAYSPYFLLFDAFKGEKIHILEKSDILDRLDDEVYEGFPCYKIRCSKKIVTNNFIQNVFQQAIDTAKSIISGYEQPDFELPDQTGIVEIFWFRKKDYLLMRNEKYQTMGEYDVKTVITYQPKIDIVLREEDFK